MSEQVLTHDIDGGVRVIRINRPHKRNALASATLTEIVAAVTAADGDPEIRCIVLTGDDKAFAAGADVAELKGKPAPAMLLGERFEQFELLRRSKTPLIAAVSGYALGGGLELAMTCDIIVASETAMLGQPEINLGIMPGAGGTQRLTRQLGKYLAMEMVLAGRMLSAKEAHARGLVNQVHPVHAYLDEAKKLAKAVASRAPLAVRLARDAILQAQSTTLEQGLRYERHNYYLCFATEDKEEGVGAFLDKRDPRWQGK